ncbi:hypothetical protein C8Q76DRAFT_690581 [Earliella scabrosa]|nr:hypothetical protein C8Q76DRAFT_690581 [Earliella scabrosa]
MSTPVATPSQRTLVTSEALYVFPTTAPAAHILSMLMIPSVDREGLKIEQLRALARAHATRPRKSVAVNTLSDAKVVSFLISKGLATHWPRIARAVQSGGDLGPTPPRGVARREWFVDNLILSYVRAGKMRVPGSQSPGGHASVGSTRQRNGELTQSEQSPAPPPAQPDRLDKEGTEGSAGVEPQRAPSTFTESQPPPNQLASSTYGSCRQRPGTTAPLALLEGSTGQKEGSDLAAGPGRVDLSDRASANMKTGDTQQDVEDLVDASHPAPEHPLDHHGFSEGPRVLAEGPRALVTGHGEAGSAKAVARSHGGPHARLDRAGETAPDVQGSPQPADMQEPKGSPTPSLQQTRLHGFVRKWLIHQRFLAIGGEDAVGDWPNLADYGPRGVDTPVSAPASLEHATHDVSQPAGPEREAGPEPAAPRAPSKFGLTSYALSTGRGAVPDEDYFYEEVLQTGLRHCGFPDPIPLVAHVFASNHWGDGDVWTAEAHVAVLAFDYRYPSHGPTGYKRVDILTLWLRYVRAEGVVITHMNTFIRELAIALRLLDPNVVISMGTKVEGLLWYHPVAETTGDGEFVFLNDDDEDVEVVALEPREKSRVLANCHFGIYCRLDQHRAPEESSRDVGLDHSDADVERGDGGTTVEQDVVLDQPPKMYIPDPPLELPLPADDEGAPPDDSLRLATPKEGSVKPVGQLVAPKDPAPAIRTDIVPVLKSTHKVPPRPLLHGRARPSRPGMTQSVRAPEKQSEKQPRPSPSHSEVRDDPPQIPSVTHDRQAASPHGPSSAVAASPTHAPPPSPPPVSAAEARFRAALGWLRAEFGHDEIVVDMICEKPRKSQILIRMLRWIKRTHELARLGRVRVDGADVRITKRVLAELLRRKNQFLNHAIDSQELIDSGHPAVKRAIERLVAQGSRIGASSLYKGLSQAVQNPDVDVEWPTNIEDDEDEDEDHDAAPPPKRPRKRGRRTREASEGSPEGPRYSPLNEQSRRELLELAAWEGPQSSRRGATRRAPQANGAAEPNTRASPSEPEEEGSHDEEDNAWLFDEDQDDDVRGTGRRQPHPTETDSNHSLSPVARSLSPVARSASFDARSPSPVALPTAERIALRRERLAAMHRELISPLSSQDVPHQPARTSTGRTSTPYPPGKLRGDHASTVNDTEGTETLSRERSGASAVSYASDPDAEGETEDDAFAAAAHRETHLEPSRRHTHLQRSATRSPLVEETTKRARANSRADQATTSALSRARSPPRKRARAAAQTETATGATVTSTKDVVAAPRVPAVADAVPMIHGHRSVAGRPAVAEARAKDVIVWQQSPIRPLLVYSQAGWWAIGKSPPHNTVTVPLLEPGMNKVAHYYLGSGRMRNDSETCDRGTRFPKALRSREVGEVPGELHQPIHPGLEVLVLHIAWPHFEEWRLKAAEVAPEFPDEWLAVAFADANLEILREHPRVVQEESQGSFGADDRVELRQCRQDKVRVRDELADEQEHMCSQNSLYLALEERGHETPAEKGEDIALPHYRADHVCRDAARNGRMSQPITGVFPLLSVNRKFGP